MTRETELLGALRAEIRRDMNNYTDDLANGTPQDFPTYQRLVGVIHGLALAEQHLLALAKKLEEPDDDE
jgi:hypothetical protein